MTVFRNEDCRGPSLGVHVNTEVLIAKTKEGVVIRFADLRTRKDLPFISLENSGFFGKG